MTPSRGPTLGDRAYAARPGGGYDRFVGVAKAVLPVAALAVLAACLIWPLTATQDFSFLVAKDNVGNAGERLRIDRAVYRGADGKGQSFEISAASAVQRTSATPVVELRDIAAQLVTADGPARVSAPFGRYDMTREVIEIAGVVRFDGGDGTMLETRDVSVDLPTRRVRSGGPVTGRVPLGSFRAGRISADVRGHIVVLDGGASLRIVQRRGR